MVTHRTKGVFQIVVGAWKISHLIAEEKPCPIAVRSSQKGSHHVPKRLRNSTFLSHLIQQGLILLLYVPGCVLLRMSQDVRSSMHPGIPSLNIGP